MRSSHLARFTPIFIALILLTGCAAKAPAPAGAPLAGREPAVTATARPATADVPPATTENRPTPAPTPTALRAALGVEVGPDVPPAAAEAVLQRLAAAGIQAEPVTAEPDLRLSSTADQGGKLAWERFFALVDRTSSVLAGIAADELAAVWAGTGASANFTSVIADHASLPELTALLGPAGPAVTPQPAEAVTEAIWADKMGLGIVPFDALSLRLRAIPLDGSSPTDNRFRAAEWPLTSRTYAAALTARGEAALAGLSLPITNRDPDKLTVLVMTGVTAIARGSAAAIERSGDPGFLARQVGPELAAADLTIISNEIPFVEGCVADNTLNNLLLCSKPAYWENLALSGVDAIGLTGNHMNDFGYDNFRRSLALYAQKKIPTYGGGMDDKAARLPLVLEHHGNRLGFLGANQWGPEWYTSKTGETVSAWAGPDHPGAARFDQAQIVADIRVLKPQVDLVFAEVQHTEFNAAGDYQTEPIPQQEADFRAMSDAGADVVTGVMAHAPQAVELRDGRAILYGLGNLFFDQTWSWPTRTGLVARHTIYDGKLINTELLVTVISDNFQLRWATPEERVQVLRSVFDVSRW